MGALGPRGVSLDGSLARSGKRGVSNECPGRRLPLFARVSPAPCCRPED